MRIFEIMKKAVGWPTGPAAIKKHDDGVRDAMLEDGYTSDEIEKILEEEDKNPDPGLTDLLKGIRARKNVQSNRRNP